MTSATKMDETEEIMTTDLQVAVVMVPLPAQGHLEQLLNLSRLILAKGIPVHYVGSATHNHQAKSRLHCWDVESISNIYFHDLPLPDFSTPAPNPNALNKFPAHLQPTFDATLQLREPLGLLLRSLSCTARRVIVVHDSVMAGAAQAASSIPNAEIYVFYSVSAFAIFFYYWEALGRPKEGIEVPNDLPDLSLEGCFTDTFLEFIYSQQQMVNSAAGDIYNTCRPIEGTILDLLAQETLLGKKKQWALGPVHPIEIKPVRDILRHKCLEWLDDQPKDSVLYVSFGTMTSIADSQICELAIALEQSEQRFIWVLREADKGDIYADGEVRIIELPDGFEGRMEGRGVIVRDWAPQLEILAHKSTGGFLSHCGWNSCMESLSMGVPIAAWPMHSDQPRNTMLVTKVLKVGVVAREWERREEIASRDTIERAIRDLMVSEEGMEIRRRAEELGIAVRQAASKGGTSSAELDSFITHISR